MTYIYAADVYCDDCGEEICRAVHASGNAPADPDDQSSYDSDQYPKSCSGYSDEADCPQHCGSGDDCINAHEFADGHKIGVWLENDLTSDGVDYVKEAVRDGGEVAELWAEYYDWIDFDDCNETNSEEF